MHENICTNSIEPICLINIRKKSIFRLKDSFRKKTNNDDDHDGSQIKSSQIIFIGTPSITSLSQEKSSTNSSTIITTLTSTENTLINESTTMTTTNNGCNLSVCSLPLSISSSSMSSSSSSCSYTTDNALMISGNNNGVLTTTFPKWLNHREPRKLSSESSDEYNLDFNNTAGVGSERLIQSSSPHCPSPTFPTLIVNRLSCNKNNLNTSTIIGSSNSSVQNDLTCSRCNLNFSSYEQQIEHFRTTHPHATLLCKVCSRCYSVDEMNKHIRRCRGNFPCNLCSSSFSNSALLKKHIQRIHQLIEQAPCNICGKILSSKSSLQNHMKQHDDSYRDFKCKFCEKTFIQRVHFLLHLERHHANQELSSYPKTLVCETCGNTFMFEGAFKHHLSTHRRKENCTRSHKCETCQMEFQSESELVRHSHIHVKTTPNNGYRQFRCPTCDQGFHRQYSLFEHILSVHLDPSQMECRYCGKRYLSNDSLRRHIIAKHMQPFTNKNTIDTKDNANNTCSSDNCSVFDEVPGLNDWFMGMEESPIFDQTINYVIRDGNLPCVNTELLDIFRNEDNDDKLDNHMEDFLIDSAP